MQAKLDKSNQERRRHPRQPLMRYLEINTRGWHDFSVWGHDVSSGGVGLAVDRPVTLGDRFFFDLGGQERAAEVCSVRQQGDDERYWVGLRWLSAPAGHKPGAAALS